MLEHKVTKVTKAESWVQGEGGSGRDESGSFRLRLAALAMGATTDNG